MEMPTRIIPRRHEAPGAKAPDARARRRAAQQVCRPLCLTLMAALPATLEAATTLSQSVISSCLVEPADLTSRSEVVNGSALTYRTRVIASHYESNAAWDRIDVAKTGWAGTSATVSHEHNFPSGLFTGSDRLRIRATHLYQRCASGFWEMWREETTDQIGCGRDEG